MSAEVTGGTAGAIIGSAIPGIGTAAGAALGVFVGGIYDVGSSIVDVVTSLGDALGKGPGQARTDLRNGLAPVLAHAVALAGPTRYVSAMLAASSFLQNTIVPAFNVVAHFGDDPTFVADTMGDVATLAPAPAGVLPWGSPTTLAGLIGSVLPPGAPNPFALPPPPAPHPVPNHVVKFVALNRTNIAAQPPAVQHKIGQLIAIGAALKAHGLAPALNIDGAKASPAPASRAATPTSASAPGPILFIVAAAVAAVLMKH